MGICPYVKRVPAYIKRINKPRMLGMIIYVLESRPSEVLSAHQVSDALKHKGLKHYPHTRAVAAMLAKHKLLFEEVDDFRVRNGDTNYKIKQYKLRDDWDVDRKV